MQTEEPAAACYKSKFKKIKLAVIILGDSGVGKSTLLHRYTKGELPRNKPPTIGIEFVSQNMKVGDGSTVKAQIWDTAGHEKYRAITAT